MIFQDKSTVAITKCTEYLDFEKVKVSIKECSGLIGGCPLHPLHIDDFIDGEGLNKA